MPRPQVPFSRVVRMVGSALLGATLLACAAGKTSGATTMPYDALYDIPVTTIDGQPTTLAAYRGKALVIVNTASECGFTPQYKTLEELYQRYKSRGVEVLAFPSNDFGGQEPGSNEEIKTFCETRYKTTFPLFGKVTIKGEGAHPLYRHLTSLPNARQVTWNFNKFLIDRQGRLIEHFESKVEPTSQQFLDKLETALATTE